MKTHQAVRALAALAQESRLNVFRLLVTCGEGGLSAGTIAERLQIPPATLSFHLKELRNAGLVEQEKVGRQVIYRISVQEIRGLLAYLMEDCCEGRPELCDPGFNERDCGGPSCAHEEPAAAPDRRKSASRRRK